MSSFLLGLLVISTVISSMLSSLFVSKLGLARVRKRPSDLRAIQASHIFDAPRLGGLAIFISLVTAMSIKGITSQEAVLIWSGLIVFAVGLWEDISGNVSARRRLIVSMIAAIIAMIMSGEMITHVDIAIFDRLLSLFPVVALLLTVLLSASYTHAFNLIDGMNGLSSVVGISTALSLAWVAQSNGQTAIGATTLLLAGGILGFSFLNWPQGRIFLGDGGAYFIGHVLFWVAILLAAAVPGLSIASVVLILFWPVAELTITIIRRLVVRAPLGKPDRLHFHQIVRRGIEIATGGRQSRSLANAATTACIFPVIVLPSFLGAALHHQELIAALVLLIAFILYACAYIILRRMTSHPKLRRTLAALPHLQRTLRRLPVEPR